MKNSWKLLLLLFLFTSCGVNMGTRIDKGNLSVFFMPSISQDKAILFANYWVENGFVGERKQVIQLDKEKDVIQVKLIERENYQDDLITINEEAILQQLERELKREVFLQETEIIITDNTFRPILKR